MAENLNYADSVEYPLLKENTLCYGNDEKMCELYGRLYTRDAAMNSSECEFKSSCSLGSDTIQGICPDGWHIPAYSEVDTLINLVNAKAAPLMSAKGWGIEDSLYIKPGTDTYGLSFVGSGNYGADDGFGNIGEVAFMWVYYQSSRMYYLLVRGKDNQAYIYNFINQETILSVRCVKNR